MFLFTDDTGNSSDKLGHTEPFAHKPFGEYNQMLDYKPKSMYDDPPIAGAHDNDTDNYMILLNNSFLICVAVEGLH